ncbi:MAG: TRAP transporter fused permease subunit [Beijerinckiaceae bacterium]|nr:TRAP transporter fused permease subunit [Beijerinckiaceae bacterium]
MATPNIFKLAFWFSVGAPRKITGWLSHAITFLAFVVAVYVVLAATYLFIDPWVLTALFLTGTMTIAFLVIGANATSDQTRPTIPDYILSGASLACGIFFFFEANELSSRIALLTELTPAQYWFGLLMILLTLEITRRATGVGLLAVVLIFMAYNLFGHLIPGVLGHGYIGLDHFLDIIIYTTDGVMGLPARVAATYAFMFVLFGTLLYHSRGGDFFNDIATAFTGHRHGGSAKVAVASSGLYGMISGSPTSDVVTTGSVTIPMMKKAGFKGPVASGIEVAASTGGSLMPPVMGSAAFLMAEYTGIEYREIAIAALLPALLYYVCVYSQVHFRAIRLGIGGLPRESLPKVGATLKSGGVFVVPLVVLTWALLAGYTPTMVAVYGSLAVLAVAMLRSHTRLGPVGMYKALAETTVRSVAVAGATAAAGLVIGGITMTGLAAKFAHLVYALTAADQIFTFIVAAMLTIILGMGMPTPSAYILAAVLMSPLMKQVGISDLAGHMFILYFAVLSAITPPVAVAAFAAASISGDNPILIAAHAVKLALAAFLVPFVFVFGPELLWQGPLWKTAVTFVTAGVGLIFVSAAIENYSKWVHNNATRLLLAVGGLLMLTPFIASTITGLAMVGAAFGVSYLARRETRNA